MRFVLKAGHEIAFDELVARTAVGIREREPGTLVYVSHAVPDQPGLRIFYELYRDREAFEEHERQEHVQAFLAARGNHVESFEVDFLTAVTGKAPS